VATVLDAHRQQGRLYIDGALHHVARCGAAPSGGVNEEPLCFGRFGPQGLGLDGLLDDIRIYTRALSDEEIAGLIRGASVSPPLKVAAGESIQSVPDTPVALAGAWSGSNASHVGGPAAWTVWRKLIGPGQAQFDNAYAPTTKVRFAMPGEYLLELCCSDGTGVASDTMRVKVSAPPARKSR